MRYRNSKAQIFGSAFYSSNFKLHFRIDCFDSRVKRINRPQLKDFKNWKVYLVTKSVLNSFLDATCFSKLLELSKHRVKIWEGINYEPVNLTEEILFNTRNEEGDAHRRGKWAQGTRSSGKVLTLALPRFPSHIYTQEDKFHSRLQMCGSSADIKGTRFRILFA